MTSVGMVSGDFLVNNVQVRLVGCLFCSVSFGFIFFFLVYLTLYF